MNNKFIGRIASIILIAIVFVSATSAFGSPLL